MRRSSVEHLFGASSLVSRARSAVGQPRSICEGAMTFKRRLIERALAAVLVTLLVLGTAGAILWQDAQARVAHASVLLLANQVAARLPATLTGSDAQLEAAARAATGESARLLVVTDANRVVADTAAELNGMALALPRGFIERTMLTDGEAPPVERMEIGGQTVFVTVVPWQTREPSSPSDLILLAVPVAELVGGWVVLLPRLLLAGILVLAVAVTAIWLIAGRLSAPLDDLTLAIQALAGGDYDAEMPISGTDDVSQLAVAFNTLVARVKAVQQQQHNFLVNLSHDLSTSLASIQGYSQTLLDGSATSQEQQHVAEIISAETERLARWVQGLPELARIEVGRSPTNGHAVDLNSLLDRCCEKFWPRAQTAGIVLHVQRPRQALPVGGDAAQLDQVLANLVDNALAQAGPGGRVQIKATLGGVRGGAHGNGDGHTPTGTRGLGRWWVEISVAHEGPGILEPSSVPRYDSRRRADRTRASRSSAGIGLATAREIVSSHGGELLIQSPPDAGTEYKVRLPMKVSN
ncbi:MAG TPA: hypothetical protein DEP84_32325 [Chloroflexi bacterium]|nr:hypothetical protein [Chloroflexota bacterium]